MRTATERLVEALASHHVKPYRDVYRAKCPAHDGDSHDSLSLRQIEGQALVHCFGHCQTADVLAALNMTMADLFDTPRGVTYTYTDPTGQPTRYVHRPPDKRIKQSGIKGGPVLYRLPNVLEAVAAGVPVYVVEGEKDCRPAGVRRRGAPGGGEPEGCGGSRRRRGGGPAVGDVEPAAAVQRCGGCCPPAVR